jgi:hypothetical protein
MTGCSARRADRSPDGRDPQAGPDQWPGLALDPLARHTTVDLGAGAGGHDYDGRFVEILLSPQEVPAISRGETGAPRYRLGLNA